MATPVLATLGGMTALSAFFVAIMRFEMGAPIAVCAMVALPVVVVSSSAALWLQWAFGVDLILILIGSGFFLLLVGGAAALLD